MSVRSSLALLGAILAVALASPDPAIGAPPPERSAPAGEAGGGPPARPDARGIEVVAGAAGVLAPEYEGADTYTARPFPLLAIRFRDVATLDMREGAGVNLLRGRRLRAGVFVGYQFGRDDEGDIGGLRDVDGGLVGGISATLSLARRYEAAVRYAQMLTGDAEGFVVTAGLNAQFRPLAKLSLQAGPEVTFANGAYMDTFFGISPAESIASGLDVYDPRAGIKNASVGLVARYPLAGGWAVTGFGRVGYLVGEAADSPIVAAVGSRWQPVVGLGLAYRF
jgi:outer membrane protein